MAMQTDSRGQWGSSLGFILAAAGSAVGLGNIWRFPYLTGMNGGGAFVMIYLGCVLLIGLPLLYNEIGLGRLTGKNPIGAIKAKKPGSHYIVTGVLCVLVCFFVLSYYSVIAGWTIGYIFTSLSGAEISFGDFASNPGYVLPLLAVFMIMTIVIVLGGVSGGIEKAAKILMPMLLVIILALIARSLTLDGAMKGVVFYLDPDFSKINTGVILAALGQAFFSMSVGWGLMVTYGSYLPKNQNVVSAGGWIAFADTLVAFLGGLLVFPAVFAFGMRPDSGPALVFNVLPEVFNQMPVGGVIGALFFLLLMVAALTSSISMLEVPVSYLIDEKRWSRKKAAWIVGAVALVVGIPSALSSGASDFFTHLPLYGSDHTPGKVIETTYTPIEDKQLSSDKKEFLIATNDSSFVWATNGVRTTYRSHETGVQFAMTPRPDVNTEATKAAFITNLGKRHQDEIAMLQAQISIEGYKGGAEKMAKLKQGQAKEMRLAQKSVVSAAYVSSIKKDWDFLSIMDQYWGTMGVTIISLMFALFVGWRMTTEEVVENLSAGSKFFTLKIVGNVTPAKVWVFFIRWVCPAVIIIMLLNSVSE